MKSIERYLKKENINNFGYFEFMHDENIQTITTLTLTHIVSARLAKVSLANIII